MGCSIKVIASSAVGAAPKKDFDNFGGMAAGVCYMQGGFDDLRTEPAAKTAARAKMTKENFHHSVYDHSSVTLYLENIPRVIECLLDNERMMTSSVKSGRYTRHALADRELELYDKWLAVFADLIREKYQNKYMTENRIKKLAMENARYLTGAFTLVSMLHTVTYRQLNYIYGFIRGFIAEKSSNDFVKKLKPYLKDFLTQIEQTGYIDEFLTDSGKSRSLSLFTKRKVSEYFGDVYATTYRGSFAYFMHANRHRTLKYSIAPPSAPESLEFYIPEILSDKPELKVEWLFDLDTLKENYPQAMLLEITEMGSLDDFILKVRERKCTAVLLETMRRTNKILTDYNLALTDQNRTDLIGFTRGSRCTFSNFTCTNPCGFAEGVNETRTI